jgi:hypothetical protein
MMMKIAKEYIEHIVVVKGKFEHISFAKYEKGININILDIVPPEPAKLPVLVEEALSFGFFENSVEINYCNIDLNDKIKNVKTRSIMLPCHATSITTSLIWSGTVYYLDQKPELNSKEIHELTLIGCDLSLEIFEEIYNSTPPFINICPKRLLKEQNIDGPTILRCCSINEFEPSNNIAFVPWGARIIEVGEALEYLIGQ